MQLNLHDNFVCAIMFVGKWAHLFASLGDGRYRIFVNALRHKSLLNSCEEHDPRSTNNSLLSIFREMKGKRKKQRRKTIFYF